MLASDIKQEDIAWVYGTSLDDNGRLWFGCWLKDGRCVAICYDTNEAVENEALTELNRSEHAAAAE